MWFAKNLFEIVENKRKRKEKVNQKKLYKKQKIPKALREQVWLNKNGEYFNSTCSIL